MRWHFRNDLFSRRIAGTGFGYRVSFIPYDEFDDETGGPPSMARSLGFVLEGLDTDDIADCLLGTQRGRERNEARVQQRKGKKTARVGVGT